MKSTKRDFIAITDFSESEIRESIKLAIELKKNVNSLMFSVAEPLAVSSIKPRCVPGFHLKLESVNWAVTRFILPKKRLSSASANRFTMPLKSCHATSE